MTKKKVATPPKPSLQDLIAQQDEEDARQERRDKEIREARAQAL